MGESVLRKYPFAGGTQPMTDDLAEAVLNRTWRPALSVIGADGLPAIANAGNVLRPRTSLKLSLRLPPSIDAEAATREMKELLESDPPHGRDRALRDGSGGNGLERPATAPWLERALDAASQRVLRARPLRQWGRAARFRSWRCWASTSPTRSS